MCKLIIGKLTKSMKRLKHAATNEKERYCVACLYPKGAFPCEQKLMRISETSFSHQRHYCLCSHLWISAFCMRHNIFL